MMYAFVFYVTTLTDNCRSQWVPSSTIDDFWHHVVQTESRTTYYNLTEVTGAEEYIDLRRAVLRRAQVVLLCFRLDSRLQFRDAIVRVSSICLIIRRGLNIFSSWKTFTLLERSL
jgi:Ras family